jgi:ribosomal protein S18 acetylase RimI-like enzyme
MDRGFILRSDAVGVQLRTVAASDCENLRTWKNANRHAFFYQKLISPEEQMAWFRAYRERPDDHMFIVAAPSDVGCMGFRLVEGKIDVYNVIRGVAGSSRKGEMRDALRLMCAYALCRYGGREVGCKVLIDNPAVAWYERCGFVRRARQETYYEMVLQEDLSQMLFRVEPCRPGGAEEAGLNPGAHPGHSGSERP